MSCDAGGQGGAVGGLLGGLLAIALFLCVLFCMGFGCGSSLRFFASLRSATSANRPPYATFHTPTNFLTHISTELHGSTDYFDIGAHAPPHHT